VTTLARVLALVYRVVLRPLWPGGGGPGRVCRFEPTCSSYAVESVRVHGALRGCVMAAGRLCRCHPWNDGGFDPVRPR
jgi:putative membrane protein insertion efficiency factor